MKAGDVVRLKSGGPKMTISSIVHDPKRLPHDVATCVWFMGEARDAFRTAQSAEFGVAALERLESSEKSE